MKVSTILLLYFETIISYNIIYCQIGIIQQCYEDSNRKDNNH